MSKLAHTNYETMRQIEVKRLKELALLCPKCGESQERTDWCREPACPQAYENLSEADKLKADFDAALGKGDSNG